MKKMDLGGIILAGGKSSRFGQDKGLYQFRDKKMVEYGIELLKKFTDDIIISTNNEAYDQFGLPLIQDEIRDIGGIGGLHAAIKYSKKDYNIVIPCDMPFLTLEVLRSVIESCKENSASVLATSGHHLIPTCGCYQKLVLKIIEEQIKKKDYKLYNLLQRLNANKIEVENAEAVRNINSIEDLV